MITTSEYNKLTEKYVTSNSPFNQYSLLNRVVANFRLIDQGGNRIDGLNKKDKEGNIVKISVEDFRGSFDNIFNNFKRKNLYTEEDRENIYNICLYMIQAELFTMRQDIISLIKESYFTGKVSSNSEFNCYVKTKKNNFDFSDFKELDTEGSRAIVDKNNNIIVFNIESLS
jgi:hypothetical protein